MITIKQQKMSQARYDKLSKEPMVKRLLDQWIAAGILVIHDAPKPQPTPDPKPEPIPPATGCEWDAAKLCIAGADRNFPDYDPRELVTEARRAGCNAISIEMVANDRYFTIGAEKVRDPYLKLLAECRKQGMVLFVCIWNNWAKDSYIKSHAEKFLSYVIEGGPEGVIAQPVGETHTKEGAAFEGRAFKALKAAKFRTCYNGSGGQPKSRPSGYDYLAYHSPGTVDRCDAPRGSIEITDHGQKIRDIGFINYAKVETIARKAKARGCGFGFYLYVGMTNNGSPKSLPLDKVIPAWRAMANVYKAKEPVVVPPGKLADAIDITNVIEASSGNIIDEQRIPITHELRGVRRSGNKVSFINDFPASWWGKNPDTKVADLVRCYVYWIKDGQVYGGHFDWCRTSTKDRDLGNVFGKYFKIKPPPDAVLHFMFAASHAKARTQVVKG